MTFELVKQLLEAGFPMKRFGEIKVKHTPEGMETDEQYGYPTLSELIEACWRDSHQFRLDYNKEEKIWVSCTIWGNGFEDNWCRGNNPEEAVAKLWLSLNNKK